MEEQNNIQDPIKDEQELTNKTQKQSINNSKMCSLFNSHTKIYCIVICVYTVLFAYFLWSSNYNLKKSQDKILNMFELTQKNSESNIQTFIKESESHRENMQSCVDKQMKIIAHMSNENDSLSIPMVGLCVKLQADIDELGRQNIIVSRIANDSLSRKYDAVMNNQVSEKLLDLHLGKIEHEYTNITIWAAMLTIIFLIFSFYSLFKIEQSKAELEELTGKAEVLSNNAGNEVADHKQMLNNNLTGYHSTLEQLHESYASKINSLNIEASKLQLIIENIKLKKDE